jgi:hypothetical protein
VLLDMVGHCHSSSLVHPVPDLVTGTWQRLRKITACSILWYNRGSFKHAFHHISYRQSLLLCEVGTGIRTQGFAFPKRVL